MIKQVSHTTTGTDPVGFTLALEVAYELHPSATRAPEVAAATATAAARSAGRRATAARSRRRTVRG